MSELDRFAQVLGGRPDPEQRPAPRAPRPTAICEGRLRGLTRELVVADENKAGPVGQRVLCPIRKHFLLSGRFLTLAKRSLLRFSSRLALMSARDWRPAETWSSL